MAQELVKTGNGELAAQIHVRVGTLYAAIGRDERTRRDTLPAPLDAATRKALQDYRRDLHGRLQPISNAMADRDKAKAAIALFLCGYLNARVVDPDGTAKAYVMTLMDQPLFAIMQALDDFRQGRVFDIGAEGQRIPFTLDHAPSAPRLLDQVKRRAADVQEERHKVTRLLAVDKVAEPEVSDEERAQVGALMRHLANHMTAKSDRERTEELKNIRAEADAARARAARIVQEAASRRSAEASAG